MSRVIKVGGSLLDFDEFPVALRRWLASQPGGPNVLIAGGGRLADVVRELDGRFGLGEEVSHWTCVELMRTTAKILACLLPEARTIGNLAQLRQVIARRVESRPIVFDCREFLRADEPRLPGTKLPCSWDATSDSIAARVAEVVQADELVLLKSRDPPLHDTLKSLADAGYVDAHFPTAAADLRAVRCVNLLHADAASSNRGRDDENSRETAAGA